MAVQPIILCGGPGARLWPRSTAEHPKPFIELLAGQSLFQRTLQRVASIEGARAPLVITGLAHVEQARAQMAAIDAEGLILAEPVGRDSGAAVLAGVLWAAMAQPQDVALVVASDHHIPDHAAFAAGVADAMAAAEAGEIVTFGVRPTFASTAYGYIQAGEPLSPASPVRRAARFVEKPDRSRAVTMLDAGFLWNSGNFLFRLSALIAEAQRYAPDLLQAVRLAVDEARREGGSVRLGAAFETAPRISIDVALMEKTERAAVLPIAYAWSDLGSWDAVWDVSEKDDRGNAIDGDAVVVDSRECLVRVGDGVRLVVTGLRNVAVIADTGTVLVSAFGGADLMKPALAALERGAADSGAARPAVVGRLARWLDVEALPIWWTFGADHVHGGFHENLQETLRPTAANRRARVQARQVFVYALAGERGWPGPWRTAVAHGLDHLARRYRRPDQLYRASITPLGDAADETATLYDQAFVLLALASASSAMPERRGELEGVARDLLSAVERTLADGRGGYRAIEGRDLFLANPIMHLFEASLAWVELGDTEPWRGLADRLAGFFLDHMFDPRSGQIVEVFDADWRVRTTGQAARLEPGHHFEWAWLMERWSRLRDEARAHTAALALHAVGEAGVDSPSQLVFDALNADLTVQRETSRLWPQTERIKTSVLLAETEADRRGELLAAAHASAQALERFLRVDAPGLWGDSPRGRGRADTAPALATSFYHLVGAIDRLDGR